MQRDPDLPRYAVTFKQGEACRSAGLRVDFDGNFTATVHATLAELRAALATIKVRA